MTVCHFFLQGRCRYGEKCWNEHPGGDRGGGGHGDYNRGNQSNRGGGGGFGNRVWINPSQRSGGGGHNQPSTSSRGGVDWGGGGSRAAGGREANSSGFSFSQNRFSALSSQSNFDSRGGSGDENEKHLDAIQKDMEVWLTSGQWPFSSYSVLKASISGFVELSPEELRLEHYSRRASGDMESYINSVQQLASQWRARVQELRAMNPSTRAAMTAELNNPNPSGGGLFGSSSGFSLSSSSGFGAGGFGSSVQSSPNFPSPGFGSHSTQSSQSGFGLHNTATGFGSDSTQPGLSGFGSDSTQPGLSGFGSDSTQPGLSGFGSAGGFGSAAPSATPSASSFSFTAPAAGQTSAGFSFTSPTPSAAGFGSGFGSSTPAGGSIFGVAAGSSSIGFGGMGVGGGAPELHTPQCELTANELKEFTAARFTLGQIPLRPPPAELLTV